MGFVPGALCYVESELGQSELTYFSASSLELGTISSSLLEVFHCAGSAAPSFPWGLRCLQTVYWMQTNHVLQVDRTTGKLKLKYGNLSNSAFVHWVAVASHRSTRVLIDFSNFNVQIVCVKVRILCVRLHDDVSIKTWLRNVLQRFAKR